eukprot:jgi/Chlat1/9295/Chrsp99S08496
MAAPARGRLGQLVSNFASSASLRRVFGTEASQAGAANHLSSSSAAAAAAAASVRRCQVLTSLVHPKNTVRAVLREQYGTDFGLVGGTVRLRRHFWPGANWVPGSQIRRKYTDARGYTHFSKGSGGDERMRRTLITLGVVVTGSGIYYYTHLEPVPYTGRKHFVAFRPETDMGPLLPAGHPWTKRVAVIGTRIAKVGHNVGERATSLLLAPISCHYTQAATTGKGAGDVPVPPHMRNLEWEFVVVDSPVINAFALPGGKVAHVIARHNVEIASWRILLTGLSMLIWVVFGIDLYTLGVIGSLRFSRQCELEADAIGVQVMAAACYDPRVAPHVFVKLDKVSRAVTGGGHMPDFLSTHPSNDSPALMQKALQIYEDSDCSETWDSIKRLFKLPGAREDDVVIVVPVEDTGSLRDDDSVFS